MFMYFGKLSRKLKSVEKVDNCGVTTPKMFLDLYLCLSFLIMISGISAQGMRWTISGNERQISEAGSSSFIYGRTSFSSSRSRDYNLYSKLFLKKRVNEISSMYSDFCSLSYILL